MTAAAERIGSFVPECGCGCGRAVGIASKTNRGRGWVKGQPLRYLRGHGRRRSATPIEDRFWRAVQVGKQDDCWPWTGGTNAGGYGKAWADGRTVAAHRVAYQLVNGPIPAGLLIRHKCDNPPCCNPDHLLTGTGKDNSADAVERGRHAYGTRNGTAKLTDVDVLYIRRRAAAGETQVSLARAFQVSRAAIQWVLKGRNWKHVSGGADA